MERVTRMTKGELIKFLEPFPDDHIVVVVREGFSHDYVANIVEVMECKEEAEENELPLIVLEYSYKNNDYRSWC